MNTHINRQTTDHHSMRLLALHGAGDVRRWHRRLYDRAAVAAAGVRPLAQHRRRRAIDNSLHAVLCLQFADPHDADRWRQPAKSSRCGNGRLRIGQRGCRMRAQLRDADVRARAAGTARWTVCAKCQRPGRRHCRARTQGKSFGDRHRRDVRCRRIGCADQRIGRTWLWMARDLRHRRLLGIARHRGTCSFFGPRCRRQSAGGAARRAPRGIAAEAGVARLAGHAAVGDRRLRRLHLSLGVPGAGGSESAAPV